MSVPPQLSILMPVFNEIGSIASILDIVQRALPGRTKEVIVVDDGSSDGTREWLSSNVGPAIYETDIKTAKVPSRPFSDECTIRVVFHSKNKGKGGAIQTAMRCAEGDVIVIQDADLEYDPIDWEGMYDLITTRRADVVYGSRFFGKPHRSLYYHHYIGNRLISRIFNILYNQTLNDIETCYKMFTREVLQSLRITQNDFGFEVQISAQIARYKKWRIYETGIHYYGRSYEEGKKINWKDGLKALWYLVRFRFESYNKA